MSDERLGRAVLRVYHHSDMITNHLHRGSLANLLRAGQAMDFAARLRGQSDLTPELVIEFARFAGIGHTDLRLIILPTLKAAGVLDYEYDGNDLRFLEEFVGVSAPILTQVVAVLNQLQPNDQEICFLHSIELGSWAPLTRRQHLDRLLMLGYPEEVATAAVSLTLSTGLNTRFVSPELRDDIIYNAYVWGTGLVEIAGLELPHLGGQ